MKEFKATTLVAILLLGYVASAQALAAVVNPPSGLISTYEGELQLESARSNLYNTGFDSGTPIPAFKRGYGEPGATLHSDALLPSSPKIRPSEGTEFDYEALSPYYRASFKGSFVRIDVGGAWVAFELRGTHQAGVANPTIAEKLPLDRSSMTVSENTLSIASIFEAVDLSYTAETSLLKEGFTLRQFTPLGRIITAISWDGVTPEFTEDGSIIFSSEKPVLKILPPSMKDAQGNTCTDLHYELIETEAGHELHKVIDEKGLEWLSKAVYPVVIDPSVQTFEDAWESSGLTPYGQYFNNLNEYVNVLNGHLIITQTDLAVPGRGLDPLISRTYETLAVFHQAEPYDYTPPPVNIGKGWRLNFPYVGDDYVYLWGGTAYKIEWVNDTFENHLGSHFILVKNGDSTYTLTMADGSVCEFNTAGNPTQMKDIDQNTITFNYNGGTLVSITDTIGRTVSLTYFEGRLKKITYNGAEIEFGYNGNGCLYWMDDFLDRRTYYYYDSGWFEWFDYGSGYAQKENVYLLSKMEYPTGGYTTYQYDRFSYNDLYGGSSCLDYYKYYVTHVKVHETDQVQHDVYSFSGNFDVITDCEIDVNDEFNVKQGTYDFNLDINNKLITQLAVENASGTKILKYRYSYNSRKERTKTEVYNDGTNLSYTNYFAYDDWGNLTYAKDAEGHEAFLSYANTSTSGLFMDNTGTIIRTFTNAFSNSDVPSSVHTVLIGSGEKQDGTFVKETYQTHDSEAHPVQQESLFGTYTTWLTFSGTFNEKTGQTSFPVDLTGHTVVGNGALQITGLPSGDTYTETHSVNCPSGRYCRWCPGYWSGKYYIVTWVSGFGGDIETGTASVGPFTHRPGTLGYLSCTTNPPFIGGGCSQQTCTFSVTTNWKAYPVQVNYNLNGSAWTTVSSNLQNTTAQITVPDLINGQNTLNFSESSSQKTKFSWTLYVPVDNTAPDTYVTSMTYDTYGNITSVTNPGSHTITFSYSDTYSHAYLTEISTTVDTDTITTRATYDYHRGWITSIQEPKGVASSGYDYLYTYDLLGRITKKEFPLLSGQSQRSYLEAIYDDTNRTATIIDQLRHYVVHEFDKLGRHTSTKLYTGTYGSGTLYATHSCTYRYDGRILTQTDPGNHTYSYAYDFLGRYTQITFPDSAAFSYTYDDTANKVTLTTPRGYSRISWYDWEFRLTKTEEEYETGMFAVTTYQYDEVGHLISLTDAENRTTTYTYASLYGLTKTMYPDSTYEEYVYNDAGRPISFTDGKGNETTYTYDSMSRLTQIQYADQSTVSFLYDVNSNVTRMIDNAPNQGDYAEYTYDYWNRLITETRHVSTQSYTTSCEYDTANRLTTLTYPDSMQIMYSYDDLDRMTEIRRYVDGIDDEILVDNIQFTVENLITQFDYGNSLTATFSYDTRDRLSAFDLKNGETSYLDLDYTYDSHDNLTQLVNGWRDTESVWHSRTESYSYDGLDRLASASCSSWSHSYSYDNVGNRTAKDGITYTINVVNEVTALSDGTAFSYDLNGNMTGKTKDSDTWVYTYDDADRLVGVEKNGESLGEFVYDGLGRRIQKTEDSITTTYIYLGIEVLYEENTTGVAAYIYGSTGRVAKRTTSNGESHTFYYHSDHLGSTRLITDETAAIVTAATYHPFGEPDGSVQESYLYDGKERDATGLYYYGARYYDPELGRFLTRDPAGAINPYTYCLNNPLKFIDPDGAECVKSSPPKRHKEWRRTKSIHCGTEVYEWVWVNDYGEFFWICIGMGVLLLGVGITLAAPFLVASISAHLTSALAALAAQCKALIAFLVAWIVTYWREIVYQLVTNGEPLLHVALEYIVIPGLLALPDWIHKKLKQGYSIGKVTREEGDIKIISVVLYDCYGTPLVGTTTIVYPDGSELTYMWMRDEDGVYYVLDPRTGKMVKQPRGWTPGNEPVLPEGAGAGGSTQETPQ